jgi:hypothetical protein
MAESALFLADFTSCRGADRKQYCDRRRQQLKYFWNDWGDGHD